MKRCTVVTTGGRPEIPFLPVREEFHPKRNQARQKLATLPVTRFEDLSSDVYFELARRYPEFKEEPSGLVTPGSNYDDYPVSDFPNASPPRNNGRTSADRPSDSGYGGSSVSSRRPSEDRRRPSEDRDRDYSSGGRRSADTFPGRASGDDNSYSSSRRRPSQDTTRRSDDRDREREYRSRGAPSINSDTSNLTAQQSTTATSGMIIPNKSTIEEEYIEVPYGRETRDSVETLDDRDRNDSLPDPPDTASDYPMSPQSPAGGLNGLTARLRGDDDDDYQRSGSDRDRDRMEMRDVGRDKSGGNRVSEEEVENVRQDYEARISKMQTQISTLQREREDADERERAWMDSEARANHRDEGASTRAGRATGDAPARAGEGGEESAGRRGGAAYFARKAAGADPEVVDQLRNDMEGLLVELGDLSRRNDELMAAKDADQITIRDLDNQVKDYKRKYEQAKTELRSVKATSQLFLQTPKMDRGEDQLPVSSDGGILDIHVTAFLSGIDALLTAGRSNAPTRVLTPMKSVVNAVSSIVDDVRAFEARPSRERSDVDVDALAALRERAEATLSNLVAATKTHATSAGMSPVSLLDAAASHVAVTITEIARTVCIRKATRAEQEAAAYTAPSSTATSGFAPSLKSVDEGKTTTPPPPPASAAHTRKPSAALSTSSTRSAGRYTGRSPVSPYDSRRPRPPSDNTSSSDNTNSPPPIFDQPTSESAVADGSEDAWAELKPYLEAQTESIVYAIQSVLSGVRSPTPSPTLNENLTQIITIVSSIVAVCNDNLPPATAAQGKDILRELSEHANRLSEVQALPEVTKDSRQVMAKSSFAIANAMKGLMKL
ncbi:hypothetical protein MSAN_00005400 [Mycena sanguinolenta]|uniref:GIT Spa2 homology (SHD) domain-containing protein n=1 Tax=Mycena sanguinolenta TaxID=230812 RepID=A0A8H7DIU9_9AGAR|nr:hypothetical protein MSAN_00005400 [Mycena sanguinolenta]